MRITDRDQFLGRTYDKRIRSLDNTHGGAHRLFDRSVLQTFLDDDVRDHFGVGGGVEYSSGLLDACPELERIGQIAVVA